MVTLHSPKNVGADTVTAKMGKGFETLFPTCGELC
jgi:hypothetical protein